MKLKCCLRFYALTKCVNFSLFLLTFLLISFTSVYAQGIKVNGVVTDSKGNTVDGVSVSVKGATIGTFTDNFGRYSLTVPSTSSVLVFSSVGYSPSELAVS